MAAPAELHSSPLQESPAKDPVPSSEAAEKDLATSPTPTKDDLSDEDDMHAIFGSDSESIAGEDEYDDEDDFDHDVKGKGKAKKARAATKRNAGPKKKRTATKGAADGDETKTKKRKAARSGSEEKSPKPTKKPKRGRSDEEKLAIVQKVLQQMQEARSADLVTAEQNKPTLAKLQLLEEVEHVLLTHSLHRTFLDNKLLEELALWMKPMPDKTLPNVKIREFALKLLMQMNLEYVSPEQLKTSGAGRMVRLYTLHKKESPVNKDLAKTVLDKLMDIMQPGSFRAPVLGAPITHSVGHIASNRPRPKKPSGIARPANHFK